MNLAELIAAAKGDRSYGDLERASSRQPLASRWHQLATMQLRAFPDPATIRGIALALSVTEMQVIHACAESLGFERTAGTSTLEALMPPGTGKLAEDQVTAILSHVRSAIRHAPSDG